MQDASGSQTTNELIEPLARAYIDNLARAENVAMRSMFRKGPMDPLEEFLTELDGNSDPDAPFLRADLTAAAVLLARTIGAETGLATRLRRGDGPVVSIATHVTELVELIGDVVEKCALPETSRKLVFIRDGSDKAHTPQRGNRDLIAPLQGRWPIVGVAPDPKAHLPSTLTRMCQYFVEVPPIDEWTIRLVLEAICGKAYAGEIDEDVVRAVDMSDLNMSLRRDLSPEQCLERLADVVSKKTRWFGDGPALEELEGYGEAKTWGLELVQDLREYASGRLKWSDIDHKALLLSGAPGTGKTSFARALAKSAGVPLVATSVADWNANTYLSGTLQAIRTTFAEAKRQAPSLIFVDELDGISDRAKLVGEYATYWTQIVNLLLEQLAGVDGREGVVVIAATNHPDRIDPAILRAGRLDHRIELERPNTETLAKIIRFHLTDQLLTDVDLMPIAMAGRGSTGADVEAWVRRAKATARRSNRELDLADLVWQATSGEQQLPPAIRHRVAVHEIGHALVGTVLGVGRFVGVSIHERGGQTEFANALSGATTAEKARELITMSMAGRAAEKLVLGDVAVGSGDGPDSDLAKATRLAVLIEGQFGEGDFGSVYIGEHLPESLIQYPSLRKAVRGTIEAAEEQARSLIDMHRGAFDILVRNLEQRGYLSSADITSTLSAASSLASEAAE